VTSVRVSVAMTTFNGGAYVGEQLESFTRQTRPPDELVICDDCSSDDTVEQLEAFERGAPFEVRIERNPTTLTTAVNFEKAVSLCTGDIVLMADQDDVWLPHKIRTLVDVLESHPAVGAVFSNARVVDDELNPLDYTLWDSLWFHPSERAKVRAGRGVEVFLKHVVAAATTLAFRASYRDLYLPFPALRHCHDPWITFLIASVAEVRIEEQSLIDYRLHASNQFGLRKLSLREQFAKAKEQLEIGAFSHDVEFFTSARDRLVERRDQRFRASARTLALIEEKIDHCRRRDEMSPKLVGRLPAIAGEMLSRRYWRYSYGIKSVAQDIWLR
jgi:glycosyltransferase involved in cell wall biosynthesis